jgi:hypothetical protein
VNAKRTNKGEGADVHALVYNKDEKKKEREHVNRKQD